MKRISILGSTGSIGQSTLDVVERHPDSFSISGLAEGHDVELLARQAEKFRPRVVSVRDEESAARLKELLRTHRPEILTGIGGASAVAAMEDSDVVVSAIVGAAGLLPTVAAIRAGKSIALANKETMVVAGALVKELASEGGVSIVPVDSEHSAIFQSLAGHRREDVSRIILTASGGPFLRSSLEDIERATPEAALKHPRWNMGAKITIDSASLMNKGLEVIEARWLFDMPPERIAVVVHPQSIVHSMVEYRDGCVVAQMGVPDMRAPIAYAIAYPARVESGVEKLDLASVGRLDFEEPDAKRFPCLALSFEALAAGDSMPAVLNAANEVAVAAFIEKRASFTDIYRIVKKTMDAHSPRPFGSVEEILEVDRWARETARETIR
ncbi:MAG TPA: 1-deoxy-D-xylulose-5-phosphate reductoisomerase [bacterium]|nr:1-deoxy-D-xylulose-5-phosphate reductoisomerase [bacterium]